MKFIGTKELETERLLLRKVTINDAEKAFEEWCSKSEVEKYVHGVNIKMSRLLKIYLEYGKKTTKIYLHLDG